MSFNNNATNNNATADNSKLTLAQRLAAVKTTRWIRFGLVSVAFFAFVVWLGNPWVGLLWFLLCDIYLTQYIPWSWWKKTSGGTRKVMAWVDAIVYALVLVYVIFAFIGQNYKIPSSSLEKSLLVGDYLWVSKFTYGPRVPQTPLHFPLAQHTLPIVGTKSYIEHPQLDYHRMPGLRSVERGDIVVFNFPEGDTILSKYPTDDYYMIVEQLRREGLNDPQTYIRQNPDKFGEIIVRPVDRRENYVKRCIGLPGEIIESRNDSIFINGKLIPEADNIQYNYIVNVSGPIDAQKWKDLGVRGDDFGSGPMSNNIDGSKFYSVPLTAEMKKVVEKWPEVKGPLVKESLSGMFDLGGVYPHGNNYGWTRSTTSKFWIPKSGSTLRLTLNNLPIYRRAIETYEGNKLEVKDGKIFINGKQTDHYTFKMDYYWMLGDNRDRSLDSRYWGFVPEDHIVGTPVFVIISLNEEKSLLESGWFRTDRFLKKANPDKEKFK
ncbi:MAG: signal peptidase I [Clostridium sp.]|nr:signal peptidase I [Prevotella sp.]MCM1429770.1 signal peptidase I [Clostridium sp.]MCM1476060.1 signal peptidase I [Muribaculaceae bacterium]